MKKSKILKEREEKDFDNCINFQKCYGKWFRYKNKDDKGYCKSCVKVENEKLKEIKIDKNRNYTYDCKTDGCEKGLIL
jgi:hypothetical protein